MTIKEFKSICYPESRRTIDDYTFFTLLFRRISIYFTFVAVKLKITANQVTSLGIITYLAGLYLLTKGVYNQMLWGAILLNVGMFFDLIDGQIARFRGPTKIGSFLEIIHADLIIGLLLPCIALGLYSTSGKASINILVLSFFGAISAVLFRSYMEIISRHFKATPEIFLKSKSRLGRIIVAELSKGKPGISKMGRYLYLLRRNIFTTCGIVLPLLLVCIITNKLLPFVIFYSIAHIFVYVTTMISTVILLHFKKIDFK